MGFAWMDFEKLEELALKFALTMNHSDLPMDEVSQKALHAAIEWEDLKQDRLQMFHSNPKTRSNWLKASGRKITKDDIHSDLLGKGSYYWIIPTNKEHAVYARFFDFDDGEPEFETPEGEPGHYKAKEILLS